MQLRSTAVSPAVSPAFSPASPTQTLFPNEDESQGSDLESSFNELAEASSNAPDSLERTTTDVQTLSDLGIERCGHCYGDFDHKPGNCVCCDNCDLWYHTTCIGIGDAEHKNLSKNNVKWYCTSCQAEYQQSQRPMGIITQTLSELHLAPTQPEPDSTLSQVIREFRNASVSSIEVHLPSIEEPLYELTNAKWGALKGSEIAEAVNSAYEQVVKWRKNLFQVPTGKVGQRFIEEMTKAIRHFTSSSSLQEVALTMVMVMPSLLLQKPSKKFEDKGTCSVPREKVNLVV